ncbi:MAG: hypothetical protein ACRDX8_05235 [Acidimicrobiales bacterium]
MAAALVVLGCASGLLAGCQQADEADAQSACAHVSSSIALFDRSEGDASASAASADRAAALFQLRLALPKASLASTQNRGWDALVTTLSETNRVPESSLISALTQQCAVFTGSTTQLMGLLPMITGAPRNQPSSVNAPRDEEGRP